MKAIILAAILSFTVSLSYAQSKEELQLLNLSARIFKWETGNQIDSLEITFHPKFLVTGADGSSQAKKEYISRLRSGDFVHHRIAVESDTAIAAGNTATVSGRGTFDVTVSGKPVSIRLSYLEVFTREAANKPWKVLAMKANALP